MASQGVRACFVLSAGRTGTVALAKRLHDLFPDAVVLHEPPPARIELVLGNLRNDTGWGRSIARSLFLRTRRQRLDRLPAVGSYVEINPLLCPMVDLLPELGIPFNIVHMVRQPSTWAQSITAFGASARYRPIIDCVPFAKPYPNPRPAGWGRMTKVERALWRWRACNERIAALRSNCAGYELVRYEDLFSSDGAVRAEAFHRIVRMVPGHPIENTASIDIAERHNPGPGAKTPAPRPELVQAVCGDLARSLGYQLG